MKNKLLISLGIAAAAGLAVGALDFSRKNKEAKGKEKAELLLNTLSELTGNIYYINEENCEEYGDVIDEATTEYMRKLKFINSSTVVCIA